MAEQIYPYALTTLQRVKDRLNITVADSDAVLQRLINAATDYIESNCCRRFKQANYVEIYSVAGEVQEYLCLNQAPVTALTKLEYRAGTPSTPNWTPFIADQYELLESGESGLVRIYGAFAPVVYSGTNAIRATYTAGYLFDFANFGGATHTLPADLTDLCERMVVRFWKKREKPGVQSESIRDSSVTWKDTVDEDDKDVIARHTRPQRFI